MRVPRYDQQVSSRALPTPTARAESSGLQQLGGAIQQAAGVAGRIAAAEKEKADRFREAQIDLEFGKAINDASWGDNGFMLQQGENGLDPSEHLKRLEKVRGELAGRLTGDQRARWDLKSAARLEEAATTFERHSGGQRKALYQEIADGQVKLSLDNAALAYDDPNAVESALQKPLVEPDGSPGVLVRALHDRGLPAEQIQVAVQDFKRKGYAGALDQFLANNDAKGAKGLLDGVRDQMGPLAAQYDKRIEAVGLDQEAEGLAGQFVDFATDDNTGRIDEKQARGLLETVKDTKLRDEVGQRLEHKIAAKGHEWAGTVDGHFDAGLTAFYQTGSIPGTERQWLIANAPKDWARLDSMTKQIAKSRGGGGGAGKPTPEQRYALTAFEIDVAQHPEKYADMPLERFRRVWGPLFHPKDMAKADEVFVGLKKQGVKPEKLVPLENKILLQVGRDAGAFPAEGSENIGSDKWTVEQADTFYTASQELKDRKSAYKQANGKEPPLDEVRKWAGELFLKGKIPGTGIGGYFQDTTTLIQARQGGTAFDPEFTDEQKDQAKQALEAAGARADERSVDAYLRRKLKLPALPIAAAPEPEPIQMGGLDLSDPVPAPGKPASAKTLY